MNMRNEEVAWIFYELADLLEFKGENFFKIRAYRNAARVLSGLAEPLEEIGQRGEWIKVPGIGKIIAAKIDEILTTGHLNKLEKLRCEIPPGIVEIMSLPGIGPKRAALFYEKLGVASIAELDEAAKARRLRNLPGMGAKGEQDIIRNIRTHKKRDSRMLLATARLLAGELRDYLLTLPDVVKAETGGSVRRWQETVGDIDLVVAAPDPEPVFNILKKHPRVKEVLERSREHLKLQTKWGIVVDLKVVPEEHFARNLFFNTGSRAHLDRLKDLLITKEMEIAGLENGTVVFSSEQEIYKGLGLSYIQPELREDRGEVEAAAQNSLPPLVELEDIRGDLHIHTVWSDGLCTIGEVAKRAREKGYEYIAITDHSQSLKIAGGLSLDELEKQHKEIRSLNEKMDGFTILTGIEADILPGGEIDCPDEILKDTDLVIASVHSAFKQDRETMTARVISAIENKNVDIIGHPTGRLLSRRDGYDLDLERVLEASADCDTILEINSSPDRLDLNDINARRAKEKGIKIAINTDAHDLKRMDEMCYGVSVARRAWLAPGDIVNTMPAKELIKFLRK